MVSCYLRGQIFLLKIIFGRSLCHIPLLKLTHFLCMCVLPSCMSVHQCVLGVHEDQKNVLDSLEPEL